jgi:hypothetical protein
MPETLQTYQLAEATKSSSEQAEHVETTTSDGLVAVGRDILDIAPGYWRSFGFLGSVTSIFLMTNGLYLAYMLPVGAKSKPNSESADLNHHRSAFWG